MHEKSVNSDRRSGWACGSPWSWLTQVPIAAAASSASDHPGRPELLRVPSQQRLEHARRHVCPSQVTPRRWWPRSDPALTCIPTSRRSRVAITASRTTSSAPPWREDGQVPVRRSIGQGPLPDPEEPQDRGRLRPAPPDRPEAHVQALRALRGAQDGRPAGRPALARSGT